MKPTTSKYSRKQSGAVLFGLLFVLIAMLGQTISATAQTYRGGINGTVPTTPAPWFPTRP